MRTALPWILLALVSGGWIASTLMREKQPETVAYVPADVIEGDAATAEVAQLRTTVDELRTELTTLRAKQEGAGPELATAGKAAGTQPAPARTARREETPEARAKREAEQLRAKMIRELRKGWYDALRSLKDKREREAALTEMRAAFDGENEVRKLAALQLSRWLGPVKYDRADWRRGILPHARSVDPEIRAAAVMALAYVQPEPSDLDLWADVVQNADRGNAEEVVQALVRISKGVVRGKTAEWVLHLLRDGTRIRRAGVIRGLQSTKEWDPKLEARLIELVSAPATGDSVNHYYFHFLTPRMDPKSDAVLALMLDKVEAGEDVNTVVRGFRTGLDERQQAEAADALIGYAENAATTYILRSVAEALGHTCEEAHIARIEALGAGDGIDKYTKSTLDGAIHRIKVRMRARERRTK